MIKDFWHPVHFQLWIQIAQLKVTSQSTVLMCGVLTFFILTLNPLIKAVCLLENNFEQPTSNRKFSQTDGSQTLRETTVIMYGMHLSLVSHPNLLNLLGALNFKFGLSMSFCSRSRKPLLVSFEIAKICWSFFLFRWQNPLASFEITHIRWSFYAIDREIFWLLL
jgi:hypothetical protein